MKTESTHVHIDLTTREAIQKPYPLYTELRQTHPVHWNPSLKGWLVTRYDDVRKILLAPGFSVDKMAPFAAHGHGAIQEKIAFLTSVIGGWMVFKDPPQHTRLRRVLQGAFLPREIRWLRPKIESISDSLLVKVAEKHRQEGKVDLIWDFAFPLPAIVIGELCGVSADEAEKLKYWADDIGKFVLQGRETEDKYDRSYKALLECVEFYRDLVTERRKNPKSDLVNLMIESPGVDVPLNDDEIVSTLVLLLFAGHETTTNLIGNGMFGLLRNHDQLELMQNDPSLIPSAVEEFLRFEGPAATVVRTAKRSVSICGHRIKAGERVFLSLNSADHDMGEFEDPEQLDVLRKRNKHVAFGLGIHVCLGAPLARLEGEIAFRMLLDRFCDFELLDGEPEWRDELITRGLKSLPVRFRVRK